MNYATFLENFGIQKIPCLDICFPKIKFTSINIFCLQRKYKNIQCQIQSGTIYLFVKQNSWRGDYFHWQVFPDTLVGVFRKKCVNLLVETDMFCHFRGLILCNAKSLQFHQNKKQEHRGTVQQVLYSPISYIF